jgi:hypothetical protein
MAHWYIGNADGEFWSPTSGWGDDGERYSDEEREAMTLPYGGTWCLDADEDDGYDHPWDEDDDLIDGVGFADPGGHSALRAASASNPRDRPCPTCHAENVLTRIDVARGYHCNRCAEAIERGWDIFD